VVTFSPPVRACPGALSDGREKNRRESLCSNRAQHLTAFC
jgi:hypothetical protein